MCRPLIYHRRWCIDPPVHLCAAAALCPISLSNKLLFLSGMSHSCSTGTTLIRLTTQSHPKQQSRAPVTDPSWAGGGSRGDNTVITSRVITGLQRDISRIIIIIMPQPSEASWNNQVTVYSSKRFLQSSRIISPQQTTSIMKTVAFYYV